MVYSSSSVCVRRGLRVCGDVAGHGGDGTAFGGRSGVSRPMCSCMVADTALDVVLAGGGLRFSGF